MAIFFIGFDALELGNTIFGKGMCISDEYMVNVVPPRI
jgi:hypothetical protein